MSLEQRATGLKEGRVSSELRLSLYLLGFQVWEGLGRRDRSKLLEKRDRIRIHRSEQFRVGG